MRTAMSLLTIVILSAAAAMSAKSADQSAGEKTFQTKCVTCHAKDGKGNPAMVKMFKVDQSKLDLSSEVNQKKTDQELAKVVTLGNGKMPAFKDKLKDDEIVGVVAFVRSMASVKPAADKSSGKPTDKPLDKPTGKK